MSAYQKNKWGYTIDFGWITFSKFKYRRGPKITKGWQLYLGEGHFMYTREIELGHPSFFRENGNCQILPDTITGVISQ